MTFDEAIKRLSQDIDKNGGQEKYQKEVIATLKSLKKEYAPTVEMTKRQYHSFELWKYHTPGWNMTNCAEFARDENMKANDAMTAWLHPETIKVVDE